MKCPYCGAEAVLRSGDYVYHHPKYKNHKVWVCSNFPKCDSYVGCHKGTDKPLGRMADHDLRVMKMMAHKAFDVLWRKKSMTRRDAYAWLAGELGLPIEKCHIGMFDISMCRRVIEVCKRKPD